MSQILALKANIVQETNSRTFQRIEASYVVELVALEAASSRSSSRAK